MEWLATAGWGSTYRDGMPRSAYRWHISFPGRVASPVGSVHNRVKGQTHSSTLNTLIPRVRHRVDTDVRSNLDVVRTRIRYLYPLIPINETSCQE